ncbi:MAG: hypothetical protein M1814_002605 [Vezdaea aestivalis]|nr:MAG: hypothetical protein M1814_002605 [Vezdaea aestivalis]
MSAIKELHIVTPFDSYDGRIFADHTDCWADYLDMYRSLTILNGAVVAGNRRKEDLNLDKCLTFRLLSKLIWPLLQALRKNQLIGFSLDIFGYVPVTIATYLQEHQQSIQKLSLAVAEVDCKEADELVTQDFGFVNLEEIHWAGVPLMLSTLSCQLHLVLDTLITLELDFLSWHLCEDVFDETLNDLETPLHDDKEEPNQATPTLALFLLNGNEYNNRKVKSLLPRLKNLSLREVSFEGSQIQLINAFNMLNVHKLRLLHCPSLRNLLEFLHRESFKGLATKVELVVQPSFYATLLKNVTLDFLTIFTDLEDLFFTSDFRIIDTTEPDALLRHKQTLKRLVLHRRHVCEDQWPPDYQSYCDSPLEYRSDQCQGTELVETTLRHVKVKCFGICGQPRL